ncbi:MAG: spermidine/putrescine ABC transporter substrate-binding protein [Clostridia bacterium]|nr:spermidine/putrescine ABC transporter substrate-binding protein [Clostridia bacterium]
MKKVLCVLLAALVLLPTFALADEVVNVFNWEDYIDESVLAQFEEETGIKVNYMRFTDNEEMVISVEANPGAFDVVFPSDYMVERLMNKGLLAEINYDNIPNFANIRENLKNPSYDANNAHSVPYMWGTLGILYNTKLVDEADVQTWGVLWNQKYAGQVLMMDSLRDTMGLALLMVNPENSMNSTDFTQLRAAADLLIQQKQSGMVKAYGLDEFKDKMVAGEGALAVVYSGDAEYAIELNEDLAYVVPQEGSNIWVDCAVIPVSAKNKENAEKFIDFLCRGDIAPAHVEEIGYCSPNTPPHQQLGEDYQNSSVMNPSDEVINRCEYYHDMDEMWLNIYTTLYSDVLSTKVK